MKQGITIQERLKDLRTERHLKLEELAELTQISKSALGSYENDVKKEISHKSILKLAEFYGVSTDYLLWPLKTETAQMPDLRNYISMMIWWNC
jgi:transcriptional regulator with XRE-family HTH domain